MDKRPEKLLSGRVENRLNRYISAKARKAFREFWDGLLSYEQAELSARHAETVDRLVVSIFKASSFAEGKRLLDSAPEEIQALTVFRFSDAVYSLEYDEKTMSKKIDPVAAAAVYSVLISGPILRAAEKVDLCD